MNNIISNQYNLISLSQTNNIISNQYNGVVTINQSDIVNQKIEFQSRGSVHAHILIIPCTYAYPTGKLIIVFKNNVFNIICK